MSGHRVPSVFPLAALLLWMTAQPLWAISCFSELGIVRDVDSVHLARQAERIIRRLAELGRPLDAWEMENLEVTLQSPGASWAVEQIQRVLDAHCLIALSVSAEGEIRAVGGPALPYIPTGGWGTFLIKVDNLARQGTSLHIGSPNAINSDGTPSPDRWMRLKLWPEDGKFSGERVDYFLLSVGSDEQGKREALFEFSSDLRPVQQPGPLSYNRHPVLFTLMNASEISRAKLAHALKHQHGRGYQEALNKRGPPLEVIRAEACLECHTAAKPAQSNLAQLEREKSCMICHRELNASGSVSTRCSICGMENCQMGCLTRGRTQSGEPVATMSGIPKPLFLGGVGVVLVISFVVVEILNRGRRREQRPWRWNFLSLKKSAECFRKPWLRPLLQVPILGLFGFMIFAGFAGDNTVNLTPTLTWTIWWAGLIFLVLFLGKAWCFVCPWDGAATLVQYLGRLWGSSKPLTLGLPWPRPLRNIYLAIGLFILLTWLELGFGVTSSPRATASLALVMVALAVIPALVFTKRSFCRYGCMIGRISGLYAMFSPVEVRSANLDLCRQCRTRDCFRGNDRAPGCPTSLFLPALKENTYCIQCGFCARSCPSSNVAFNARPFAADLTSFNRPRVDESILAIILLALTSFHGLTMTPFWDSADGFSIIGWVRNVLGVGPLVAFTMGMMAAMALPMGFYGLLCWLARQLAGEESVSTRNVFLYFAYSLLPVALFYHLAHNSMHFFMEGQYIIPLLSDPLGRGWDLFGTAALRPGPILSAQAVWGVQVALVIVGHIFGIVIAHHASLKLYLEPRQSVRALLPMLGGMVLYSWFSLWILHLDMNMRSSLM